MGTYVKDSLVLLDTAVFAEAYHAAYLDPNPQSVNPDYALLIPYRMIEPIPSQTPTPTYRRTTTPTPPP